MTTETGNAKSEFAAETFIPGKTWEALRELAQTVKGSPQIAGIMSERDWARTAQAIAAPLIAHELRSLVDQIIRGELHTQHKILGLIEARADERDPS